VLTTLRQGSCKSGSCLCFRQCDKPNDSVVIGSLPTLAYCTIFIVMSSEVVDLHICICIRTSHCLYMCTHRLRCRSLLRSRRPSFPAVLTCFHLFATVWREVTWAPCVQTGGVISGHFQVRRCWIKIDSAVSLVETPSSEFVQCVLWVVRLTKTVESICCAVRHTVTLPRAVRRTIRSPHSVRVLIATTTDAGRHRPSAARPTTPAVRSVGVVYYAVVPTRLLLSACC